MDPYCMSYSPNPQLLAQRRPQNRKNQKENKQNNKKQMNNKDIAS